MAQNSIVSEYNQSVRLDGSLLVHFGSVSQVMSITGKGTVATGRIERGVAKSGESIEIVGLKDGPGLGNGMKRLIQMIPDVDTWSKLVEDKKEKATIAGIEMFHKTLDEGQSGDQWGSLVLYSILFGVKRPNYVILFCLGHHDIIERRERSATPRCGIMLKGVKRNEIQRGQVLAAPGTVKTSEP